MVPTAEHRTARGRAGRCLPRGVAAASSVVLLGVIAGLLAAATLAATGAGPAVAAVLMPARSASAAVPAAPALVAAPRAGGPATIVIADYRYEPAGLTVPAGATVVVENRGGSQLSITADGGTFDTGRIPPGSSGSFTAPGTPGTYRFHFAQLPVLTGTLTVV